jgi:hypothetical protein
MSATLDIFSVKTVKPTYSWDLGTPTIDYVDFVTGTTNLSAPSNNSQHVEYVGYAPFMSVSLSSTVGTDLSSVAIRRIVDFGDYYNSETNVLISPLSGDDLFCHLYIMPGLYSIKLETNQWNRYIKESYSAYGKCLDKYCIDWNWKTLSNCTTELSVTWKSASCDGESAKTWKNEGCEEPEALTNGLYVETEKELDRFPLSWQWYNFSCESATNPQNTPVTWEQSLFQNAEQITWAESQGPCALLSDVTSNNISSSTLIWKWKNVTATPDVNKLEFCTTWDQNKCVVPTSVTWDYIKSRCSDTTSSGSSVTYAVSSNSTMIVKEAFIRVLEIPPVAYLELLSANSLERFSPYTVRLSPRKIVCGSFPIEKIVWDMGDGSPLLEQRRWSNTLKPPFVFSGELGEDYQDPRNYDVVYTYNKTPESDFCFYPSISAYCSSTGSYDCAATVVGPLKLKHMDDVDVKILQSELTDEGRVLIGQVGDAVSAWRADK